MTVLRTASITTAALGLALGMASPATQAASVAANGAGNCTGTLPAYRIQDQYRVDRTELLEWVTVSKIPVSDEIFSEPRESKQAVSLAEAIEAGGCHYRVD